MSDCADVHIILKLQRALHILSAIGAERVVVCTVIICINVPFGGFVPLQCCDEIFLHYVVIMLYMYIIVVVDTM